MTILEAIEQAYEEIKVKTLGIPLQQSYIDRAVNMLNRMMNADATRGRGLGYTDAQKGNTGAELTVADWALDYVILGLAMKLAPGFGKQLSLETREAYDMAEKAVLRMTTGMPSRGYFPSTLPLGAGNEGNGLSTITNFDTAESGAYFGDQYSDDLTGGNGDVIGDEEGNILED